MPKVKQFNEDVAPWLRLVTPILMAIVLYYVSSMDKKFETMNSFVLSIKSEQDTRTVKVKQSYDHIFKHELHKQN